MAGLDMGECRLCARGCGANRHEAVGFCGAGDRVKVALACLHHGEEPCLSGRGGAGTVFFSHCNLKCCFCQNHAISAGGQGKEITVPRLAEIFRELGQRGAANIDLVTPTHYVPQIIAALGIARARGLRLPVVYNTNAYESIGTIDALKGHVDIFLPDLKYGTEETAIAYAKAPHYFATATAAIRRMVAQVGPVAFAPDGQMVRGVIVRHLVLPGHRHESRAIVAWLCREFGDAIYVSLMRQYVPLYRAAEHPEINRRLTTFEYESVVAYAQELGMENCYVQGKEAASAGFVPCFDGRGV